MKEKNKNYINLGIVIWIAFVFIQSLFFKFTNSPETQHIFGTIGAWMSGNLLSPIAIGFASYGGYVVGVVELIASLLLLKKQTRIYGAAIAFITILGAIFFHLVTPLGINVNGDGGTLFIMAVTVLIASAYLFYNEWKDLKK